MARKAEWMRFSVTFLLVGVVAATLVVDTIVIPHIYVAGWDELPGLLGFVLLSPFLGMIFGGLPALATGLLAAALISRTPPALYAILCGLAGFGLTFLWNVYLFSGEVGTLADPVSGLGGGAAILCAGLTLWQRRRSSSPVAARAQNRRDGPASFG